MAHDIIEIEQIYTDFSPHFFPCANFVHYSSYGFFVASLLAFKLFFYLDMQS